MMVKQEIELERISTESLPAGENDIEGIATLTAALHLTVGVQERSVGADHRATVRMPLCYFWLHHEEILRIMAQSERDRDSFTLWGATFSPSQACKDLD